MTVTEPPRPLSPDEFRALAREKGWLLQEIAARWGIQPRRMSQIVTNPGRNPYYDDGLRGLPYKAAKK